MSGTWNTGWADGDLVTAAEFGKAWGCFYDHTTSSTDASLAITVPTWGADLRFEVQVAGDGSSGAFWMRMNADTGANYDVQEDIALGSSPLAGELNAQTKIAFTNPGSAAPNSLTGWICLPNYRGTSFYKVGTFVGTNKIGTGSGSMRSERRSFSWNSTAAITTVTFLMDAGNISAGSRVRGYVSG